MRIVAKIPRKEAACVSAQTAERTKPHKAFYRTLPVISSLKIQIGELLLLLLAGNEQPDGWRQFERLLLQVYEGGVF